MPGTVASLSTVMGIERLIADTLARVVALREVLDLDDRDFAIALLADLEADLAALVSPVRRGPD